MRGKAPARRTPPASGRTPGKQDNCRVGAHSVLNRGALTGTRLYLPEEWTDDEARCRKAGVPEERRECGSLTRTGLGGKLIARAFADGAPVRLRGL